MSQSVEFTCWENDKPLEIQLEPEAFLFTVEPKNTIRFEATNSKDDFRWALRITHEHRGIQLFPEGSYDRIRIYMNDQMMDDRWSD